MLALKLNKKKKTGAEGETIKKKKKPKVKNFLGKG
jgi:hypothetical protein